MTGKEDLLLSTSRGGSRLKDGGDTIPKRRNRRSRSPALESVKGEILHEGGKGDLREGSP